MRFVTTVGHIRKLIKEAINSSPVDASQSTQLLSKFPKFLEKIGVSDASSLKTIATGTRGTALETPDGKVLKVTNDEKEAAASAALTGLGGDVPGVVKVFGVWQLGDSNVFAILQEKLEPISDADGKEFNSALIATAVPLWMAKSGGDWSVVKEKTKSHIAAKAKKDFGGISTPEAQEFVKKANAAWNLLVTKFHLRDLFQTLTAIGIDFHDYHAGNMMKRPDTGELVLIDLGMSRVRGKGGRIETVTEAIKRIIKKIIG
jgi:hypothetical protein